MKNFKLSSVLTIALLSAGLTLSAQTMPTNAPAPPVNVAGIGTQAFQWLTAFNTNLVSTFENRGEFWTAVVSEQGGVAPILNELGGCYDLFAGSLNTTNGTHVCGFIEANERNTGVSGTIASVQGGPGFAYNVWDVRFSLSADFGDNFSKATSQDRMYGEATFCISKALGAHWATGLGFFHQFPNNVSGLFARLTATF